MIFLKLTAISRSLLFYSEHSKFKFIGMKVLKYKGKMNLTRLIFYHWVLVKSPTTRNTVLEIVCPSKLFKISKFDLIEISPGLVPNTCCVAPTSALQRVGSLGIKQLEPAAPSWDWRAN